MTHKITELGPNSIEEARLVLEGYSHHLLKSTFQIDASRQADYDLERITAALADSGGTAGVLARDESQVGVVCVGPREWESNIFPFRMGHIPVIAVAENTREPEQAYGEMIRWAIPKAEANQIQHLLCRAPADDVPLIHTLEATGFKHVATMLHVIWTRPDEIQRPGGNWKIREARPDDRKAFEDIAGLTLSEQLTRFTADPHLDGPNVQKLYRAWATESLNGHFADVNLVAIDKKQELAGLASGRFNPQLERLLGHKVGDLTISGVHPNHRKQGAFYTLVQNLLAWFWEREAEHIVTSTQVTNYGSHRTLMRLDGRIAAFHHCFHLWLGS